MAEMNKSRSITGRKKQNQPTREQALAALEAFRKHHAKESSEKKIEAIADANESANFESEGYAVFGMEY